MNGVNDGCSCNNFSLSIVFRGQTYILILEENPKEMHKIVIHIDQNHIKFLNGNGDTAEISFENDLNNQGLKN